MDELIAGIAEATAECGTQMLANWCPAARHDDLREARARPGGECCTPVIDASRGRLNQCQTERQLGVPCLPCPRAVPTNQVESPYCRRGREVRPHLGSGPLMAIAGKLHKLPGSRKLLFTREVLDRYLTTRRR